MTKMYTVEYTFAGKVNVLSFRYHDDALAFVNKLNERWRDFTNIKIY